MKRSLLSVISLCAAVCTQLPGFAGASCAPPPNGIVAWWQAENNTNDRIGGHDGTAHGTTLQYVSGEVGNAFRFNGFTYVEAPSKQDVKFTGPFTIECWIHGIDSGTGPTNPPPQQILSNQGSSTPPGGTIIAKGVNYNAPVDWALAVNNQKLRPHVQLNGSWYYFDCATTLNASTWYHVAMIYDGSTLKGYVNGRLDGSVNVSGQVHTSDETIKIGVYSYGGGGVACFSGLIDELALYDRALTTNELQAIYNAGSAGKCSPSCSGQPSGVTAWWTADTNFVDLIGGLTGAPHGTVPFAGGEVGPAFSFSGNNYLNVLSDPALKFSGPFTIEAWVKHYTGGNDTIIAKGPNDGTAGDYAFAVNGHRLRPHAMVNGGWYYFDCSTVMTEGAWYHVAMVFDGAHLQGYVNGVLDGSVNVSGTVQTSDNPMRIGTYCTGVHSFIGNVDELTFYNRALSAGELLAIYQAGAFGKCHALEDIDANGLPDAWELRNFGQLGVDPNADPDNDGLSNAQELALATNPNDSDTDHDGLSDYAEVNVYHTDPLVADTDGDGLIDGDEVHVYFTSPTNPDTDGDGLSDGDEVNVYNTDPNNWDTDGDGWSDGDEVYYGTNPLDAGDYPSW